MYRGIKMKQFLVAFFIIISAGSAVADNYVIFKSEIVENEYDLSINKYKEIEYVPVEYPPTEEIMADLKKIEAEIAEEMRKLEDMLKEE